MTRQTEEEYLEQQEQEANSAGVEQQLFCNINSWAYGKFFAFVRINNSDDNYLRNDGKIYPRMQSEITDLNGGTYFLTQQDAQDCLDRYNALHTDKEVTIPSDTKSDNNVQSTTPVVAEAN